MDEKKENRKEFLLNLYNQLWNSLNTRLNLIWESIGILVSAFAIFALAEKNIISLSIASTIIILLCGWYLAHNIDMSFWYNRNLTIIANIEREFLDIEDAKMIYWYFISHRKKNKMVGYIYIQSMLGVGICLIVLLLHIFSVIIPIITKKSSWSLEIFFPYFVLIVVIILLLKQYGKRNQQYEEFIKISPGKDMSEVAKRIGLEKYI